MFLCYGKPEGLFHYSFCRHLVERNHITGPSASFCSCDLTMKLTVNIVTTVFHQIKEVHVALTDMCNKKITKDNKDLEKEMRAKI